MVAPNHSIQWWWCPRKSLKVCDGSKKWAKVKQSTVRLWTRLNFAVVKALLSSPFIIINHFVSLWNGICCDYALFRSLFMSQNHRWPSHLKFVKTIEKPSLSMVNLRKNIQWWWSSGSKTIEKPSKAMVPQKKIITIPSSWKNYHRWSLGWTTPKFLISTLNPLHYRLRRPIGFKKVQKVVQSRHLFLIH